MMGRFYVCLDKVFRFGELTEKLTDSRSQPAIPTSAVFGMAFAMFVTGRGSLNSIDQQRLFPGRLRKFVGPRVPSGDTVGRVYTQLDSDALRAVLREVHFRLKRNKVLENTAGLLFVAVDGHEFFLQPQTVLPSVPEAHRDRR